MENYYSKIIESLIVLVVFVIARIVAYKLINRTVKKRLVQKSRSQIIRKTIRFIILLICLTILLIIWGVKQSELAVFIGSVLTVIGVAMFAQWSILSNITASIVLFFNHSVKMDDTISIMESKDYEIQGKVTDIGLFFVTLVTTETQEEITLPNNVFLQKTIRKIITN
ncbi:mechanosensitive ion channel domain-containing protein [Polaribacter glomeratus]|uniref:Mechanosensitive ion channel MscS domain-containing protein n=1 Tax=Polaribacter glomeratus TaxID=102 RepID=A0A2S7WUQ3_9FLAO|nr:mechanosensitive ion channel domain-containing protein [Polaribacter glomeratus]PQJ81319.1 hypothetical protein BTO16_01430 [Polaribacter glomeratus]TXD64066.1 mechanosensitive ion channel family protein [Polaribacter glomeratus]